MKKFAALAFAGLLTGICADQVAAQGPGGRGGQPGGGFGGGMMMGRGGSPNAAALLGNKSVQEELKLSEDDAKEILQKYNDETNNLLTKILGEKAKPEQVARLKQIRHQQLGFAAFQDAAIQKTLKMDDGQIKEVKEIAEDMRKEAEELRKDIGMDFTKMREMMTKIQTMQKEAVGKAVSVLKDDQKKVWEEMTGKPFTMRNEFPGGPGAPGGNRPRRDQ
jgi:phosphoenolpyruvate carboxylase